ncbi:MAG: DUF3426 domain-containing protein, partial [bacterium]
GSLQEQAEGSLQEQAEGSLQEQAEGSLQEQAEGSLLAQAEGSLQEQAEGSLQEQAEGSLQEQIGDEVRSSPIEGFDGEIVVGEDNLTIVGEYAPLIRRRTLLWTSLATVAMLILVFQFAWSNRDNLSQNTSLRPYYKKAFNLLDREPTAFHDPDSLSATNLVIRTHPEIESALIVDAILKNSGEFKQRYPELRLRFTDITGRIVASRVFKPSEYVGGEVTGNRYIPSNHDVHLSMEIVDPGNQVVGYSITVLLN